MPCWANRSTLAIYPSTSAHVGSQRIVAVHVDVVKVLALVILHTDGDDLGEVGDDAAVVGGDHVAHGGGAPDHAVPVIGAAVVRGDAVFAHGEAGRQRPAGRQLIENEHLGAQMLQFFAVVGIVHADGDHQLVIAVLIRVGRFHLHLDLFLLQDPLPLCH